MRAVVASDRGRTDGAGELRTDRAIAIRALGLRIALAIRALGLPIAVTRAIPEALAAAIRPRAR